MTPAAIFEKFKQFEPDMAPKIVSYRAAKTKHRSDRGSAIFMRDLKGGPYIFIYGGDDNWAFFGGHMALEFERTADMK